MKRYVLIFVLPALLMIGCSEEKPSSEDIANKVKAAKDTTNKPKIDKEALASIFQSIPSPLEISFLIKDLGSNYNENYLNPTSNVGQYNTSYKKALNLGIYGADLAYANIYNNMSDGLNYLGAVSELADDLSIGQFFEGETIRGLMKNNENLDSLLIITTSNFEKINLYLQNQNREQISALLLTGGWLEGLHLINQVYQETPDNELRDRIGEQKEVLEQLLQLLNYYKSDSNISKLLGQLQRLKDIFDKVTITVTEGEGSFQEVDGIMMYVDNSTTTININDEQVKNIREVTDSIREQIIN